MPRRKIIPYDPELKNRARQLRKNSTRSEGLLWQRLKGKQMKGYAFYRQRPMDRYIVDFFCPELMLAIEIDGLSHLFRGEADLERQARLESLGVRFLRFGDLEIKRNLNEVLDILTLWIERIETQEQG